MDVTNGFKIDVGKGYFEINRIQAMKFCNADKWTIFLIRVLLGWKWVKK